MQDLRYTYEVPVALATAFEQFVYNTGQWWPNDHTHPGMQIEGPHFGRFTGDAVCVRVNGREVSWGEMLVVDEPNAISWRNWWRQSQTRASEVQVTFMEVEYGTRVVLTHTGWNERNASERERFRDWPLIMSYFISSARTHESRLSRHV